MAIYHLSAKVISRSTGQSAVASAAYRSGERLHDQRIDQCFDYSRKEGVEHSEILAPLGARDWVKNRELLWNAVEAAENRKDAQLAREIELAVPVELTTSEQVELVRDFTQRALVSQGMVVDLNVHLDNPENPHAHLMMTTRELTSDGFGLKRRDWNSKEQLLSWREEWAEVTNEHLLRAGHDIRIDHRSLDAQEIDLLPGRKIGVSAERQLDADLPSNLAERVAQQRAIAAENGRRILADPQIALETITYHRATFTERELAQFLHSRTDGAEQFQAVNLKVMASPGVVELGQDELGRTRYTTQDMLDLERALIEGSHSLSRRNGHQISRGHREQVLAVSRLSAQQRAVVEHVSGAGDIAVVVGLAGSGKSTTLEAARRAWEAEGFEVRGAALSGIATENLEHSSGMASRTLAGWESRWSKGYDVLTSKDIFVIDEAGLVGSYQLSRVIEHVEKASAKLVLVGDPEQLQAIEAGAPFRRIAADVGVVELGEVRRQRVDWQKEATQDLAVGRAEAALATYEREGHIRQLETRDAARGALLSAWKQDGQEHRGESRLILAATRAEVHQLNQGARKLRITEGELGKGRMVETARGSREFARGDRLYFLKNDRELGVKNGSLGTVEKIRGDALQIRMDGEVQRRVVVDTKQYAHLDYGYAATVHKAQGVTVDRTYVLATGHLDRHSTYVALSRQRVAANLFYGAEDFQSPRRPEVSPEGNFKSALSRARPKELAHDYLEPLESGERPWTARDRAPKRSPFAGLKLGQTDEASASDAGVKVKRAPSRDEALIKAIDACRRAYADAARQRSQGLPLTPDNLQALKDARETLERARPGAIQYLRSAIEYQPGVREAMSHTEGRERVKVVLEGMAREQQIEKTPALRAARLVLMWQRTETQRKKLWGWEHADTKKSLDKQLGAIAYEFKRDPQIDSIVRQQARQLGITEGSTLDWVIRAPSLEQALALTRSRAIGISM